MTIPSHIGQYRIVRKIGAGGMGMVYLGEHMLLGRRAAIKTLLPTVALNEEIVERFFNEARAASRISDPGVIQIFDFGYHVDGTAYIVMELLEGEALSARIDRLGRLALPDALRIARQIAGSLAAAHACEIVHRDLKPENIFLVRDTEAQCGERTKILDFGICKVGSRSGEVVTQVGAMVGTPVYMSPEQCRGACEVDHRSDIYAFGCLMFHMLTGRPPFAGLSSGELIVAHMQAEPPSPSLYIAGLPFEIDALLLRCLAKAPDERYPSMAELHLVLGDIYAKLDHTESTISPVPAAMLLGQGFRSVYDGNFTGFSRGSPLSPAANESPVHGSPATHRLRPQLRFMSTPPATPPKQKMPRPSSTPDHDDEDLSLLLRPRRRAARAVVACLVLAGLVGLVVLSSNREGEAGDPQAGRAAVVAAPAPLAPAPPAEAPPPPRAEPAASAAPAASTVGSTGAAIEPAPDRPAPHATSPGEMTVERDLRFAAPEVPQEITPTAESGPTAPEAKRPVAQPTAARPAPPAKQTITRPAPPRVAPESKPVTRPEPAAASERKQAVTPSEPVAPETKQAVTGPELAPPVPELNRAKPVEAREASPAASRPRSAPPPKSPPPPAEDLYDTR